VSAEPAGRLAPHETVAGFLAALALFVECIGVVWHPLRLIPISLLLALIAAAMGGRYQRLAYLAVLIGAFAFFLGMTVAVIFKHPLW
jgi:hypothetical protein